MLQIVWLVLCVSLVPLCNPNQNDLSEKAAALILPRSPVLGNSLRHAVTLWLFAYSVFDFQSGPQTLV